MSELDQIQIPIRDEMKEFDRIFRNSLNSQVPLLGVITNYILRRKGKQMRPMFVFLSARIHGVITPKTYVAATLIELLHTATLVHDDVVDESYERRGFFSINAMWKSKISVLLGDFMLARGLAVSVENEAYDLLSIVNEAVQEMSEGELLQIQKSIRLNITAENYFDIIRKKTATLIAACTASGTKSVAATEKVVAQMKEIGLNIGIAFQIKDDLFDYERKSHTGKPTGNDLKEKKFTLPLIHSLENASWSEKRHISRVLHSNHMSAEKVDEITKFVEKNGGLDYSRLQMNLYKDKAINALSQFPSSIAKDSFIRLVNYTTDRNH
jgi:octaprenyl-diphosphate synthase